MELKYGPVSPYVRKVMVVAHEVGVADRIKLTHVKTAEEPERIFPFNPLGKIPALVLDDGSVMYDSPVICEYLDAEFGGRRLLAASGPARWRAMTRAALADGLLDAGILVRWERMRPPEQQSSDWVARHLRKILSGLDALESEAASFGETLDFGEYGHYQVVGVVADHKHRAIREGTPPMAYLSLCSNPTVRHASPCRSNRHARLRNSRPSSASRCAPSTRARSSPTCSRSTNRSTRH